MIGDIQFHCSAVDMDACSETTKHHRMLNAPELLKTVTPQPVPELKPPAQDQENSNSPTRVICDLADANAFVEEYRKPHVPVMSAFGVGRLHVCRFYGSWDLDRMVSENADTLFRSIRNLSSEAVKDTAKEWDHLTFRFGPRAFLYADKDRIIGFAATPMEAERLATVFGQKYHKLPTLAGGDFHLIQQVGIEIICHAVTLQPDTILSPESLHLHYGSGSTEWHQDFIGQLRDKNHGISIFEGRPGTGKTFYLRHLVGVLKESHRCYFIPTETMGVLTSPRFIGFWAEQRRVHSNRQFIVILEDSDAALMTRGADNREQVSILLNLSDGMRHRKKRHHLAGIEEVRRLWGDEAAEAARQHIITDLELDGWRGTEHPFPKDEDHYQRLGLF